jgi:hypothetical protein
MVRQLRSQSTIPLAFMTYINLILHYGPEAFARDCRAAGVDALIIPDLPPEESGLLRPACDQYGLDLIQFIAPTSNAARVELACRNATGFIYCVSNTGVTGVRSVDYSAVGPTVEMARMVTDIPVRRGFAWSAAGPKKPPASPDGVIGGRAVVLLLAIKILLQSAACFVNSAGMDGRMPCYEPHANESRVSEVCAIHSMVRSSRTLPSTWKRRFPCTTNLRETIPGSCSKAPRPAKISAATRSSALTRS